MAACVDLRDVRLWRLSTELLNVHDGSGSRLSYTYVPELQVQFDSDEGGLIVLGAFELEIAAVASEEAKSGETDEPLAVANISFDLNALFEVEHTPEEAFTESELTAFGQTTGQFALYPYVRELVADITGRLGLPTLHMGVMRLDLQNREDD